MTAMAGDTRIRRARQVGRQRACSTLVFPTRPVRPRAWAGAYGTTRSLAASRLLETTGSRCLRPARDAAGLSLCMEAVRENRSRSAAAATAGGNRREERGHRRSLRRCRSAEDRGLVSGLGGRPLAHRSGSRPQTSCWGRRLPRQAFASATGRTACPVPPPGGSSFGPSLPRRWFQCRGGRLRPRTRSRFPFPVLESQATVGRPVRLHRARATRLQAARTPRAEIYPQALPALCVEDVHEPAVPRSRRRARVRPGVTRRERGPRKSERSGGGSYGVAPTRDARGALSHERRGPRLAFLVDHGPATPVRRRQQRQGIGSAFAFASGGRPSSLSASRSTQRVAIVDPRRRFT